MLFYREERQKRKEEEKRKRDEKRDEERKLAELKRRNREMELEAAAAASAAAQAAASAALFNHSGEVFDSMQVEFDADDCDLNLADVEDLGHDDDLGLEDLEDDLEEDEEDITDDEDEDDMEGYEYPIGPMPQEVTNDLKSLDEMVSVLFVILLIGRKFRSSCDIERMNYLVLG